MTSTAAKLAPTERFVFVDIETSGLDVETEQIFEVGFAITDLEFNVLDRFETLIWSREHQAARENAGDFVKDMHTANNLWADAFTHGKLPIDANTQMRVWLQNRGITKDDPMCGSSISFDRGFLKEKFPEVEKLFSYRDINISTVKELCRRFNPSMYASLDDDTKPRKTHRVADCLHDTIEEAKWYKDNFLWVSI